MNNPTAYPLDWPAGIKRTEPGYRQDSQYRFAKAGGRGGRRVWTFNEARTALSDELDRLKAVAPVLSTNFPLRLDGMPKSSAATPADQGVAIYFLLDGRPMQMACDQHIRAEENMRAIALSIEAMRAIRRHGGAQMMDRAFQGFQALPAPASVPVVDNWREVLGVAPGCSTEAVHAAFRAKVKLYHPDTGDYPDPEWFNAVVGAMEEFRKTLR
jgi:hypothetical protein